MELQLGSTDETHIIRTIEYWDIERKRYPQYDHCAVLIADDITSRFLNVISLFNGTIPLIALQMSAHRVAGKLTFVFTKVMDWLPRGPIDEDEIEALPADRSYWESRASRATVSLVDDLVEIVRKFDPKLELTYKKNYIGLGRDSVAFNFVLFKPKRSTVTLEIKLPQTTDVDAKIEEAELDALEYNSHFGRFRLRLSTSDLRDKAEALRDLMFAAYERRVA